MPNTFDLAQGLCAATDQHGVWGFIRGFVADWAAPLTADDGFGHPDLDMAEDRLNVRLPDAVRNAYRLFGRRNDLTSQFGTLYPPNELALDQSRQVLVFRADHQAVGFYGVSVQEPENPDPPVLFYMTMMDKMQKRGCRAFTASPWRAWI